MARKIKIMDTFTEFTIQVHPDPDTLCAKKIEDATGELSFLLVDFAKRKVNDAILLAFEDGKNWERYQNREVDKARSEEDSIKEILKDLGLNTP